MNKQLEKKILDLETANQQLKTLVKEYRSQFENISDVVFMIGTDFNILNISPNVEKLLGYKAEDFIGKPASDLRNIFTSESFEKAITNISKLLKGEKIPATIYAFVAKDGTLKHIEIHGSPLIRDGQVAGTIFVARNVTERKEAEEALRESEQRFRLLTEAAFEAIAIHEEGVLLNANDQYFKMFGFEPDEALGKEMISLTFAPEVLESVKKRVATNSLGLFETIGLRKDGTRFPMEIRTRKMKYKGRTVRFGVIRDITERKRAEEKYSELVKYAPAGIYEIDHETGHFTSVNDIICEYTGYTREELLNMNLNNLLTEESQKCLAERIEKLITGEEVSQTVEYCIRTKKGENLWVILSARYIYESGKLKSVAGVVSNITEQRRVEEKLRESEANYRYLYNNVPAAIYKVDFKNQKLLEVNDVFYKYLGFSKEEIISLSPYDLLTEESRKLFMERVGKMARGIEVPTAVEYEIFNKKGERLWMRLDNYYIYDTEGQVIAADVVAHDITESKQVESQREAALDALRKSEDKYRTLIETTDTGYVIIDQDGLVRDANSEYVRLTGHHDLSEIVGRSVLQWTAESQKEKNAEAVKACFDKGYIRNLEVDYMDAKGDVTPIEINATCIEIEGKTHTITICRDITRRRLAEEKIRASLREKDILIREIHHRVKNNLQVISSLLGLQARSSGNPELTEMFNGIQGRIRSMAMIHETLYDTKDFTRIELSSYVKALSQSLFNTHNINPGKINLTIQTGGEIYVDITKAIPCGLVLNELISNALKHAFPADRKGKLQIIISETKNAEIDIVVRDNGVGLPDNIDIHQPQTLGLELVNGLVKNQLDGQIEVRRNNGTKIRLKFLL